MLKTRFNQYTTVYTDGSKSENAVGAGVFSQNQQLAIGLPPQCSVFSAEAYAIKAALNSSNTQSNLLILSDSASCLSAIESGKSQHPWIQQIEHVLRTRPVYLCWIPGHAGVRGNEEADRLAGEARNNIPIQTALPGADALRHAKQEIRRQWDTVWHQSRDVQLREVKFDTVKWADREDPADQRVLTRLRIGHTRLTHCFLLKKESPPVCDCCGIVVTVRHIMLECRKFDDARRMYGLDSITLRAALCNDNDSETRLLEFLKETGLYREL